MDQKQINKNYELFKIPNDRIPVYTNANDFSKNFQKCSILKDVNTTYSSSTTVISKNCNKK